MSLVKVVNQSVKKSKVLGMFAVKKAYIILQLEFDIKC